MKIVVYVEGGAAIGSEKSRQAKYYHSQMREGFHKLFEKVVEEKTKQSSKPPSIEIKLSGDRGQTFQIFKKALPDAAGTFSLLLIDAEEEVTEKDTRLHLQKSQASSQWPLGNIAEDQCHLMVQTMEAWFLADQKALQQSFKQDFDSKKLGLSAKPNIEKVAKPAIMAKLKAATNGKYNGDSKLEYCGRILLALDPKALQNLEHCKKLFEALVAHV